MNTGKKQAQQSAKEVLLFLPNLVKLLYSLADDSRVPLKEKAILLGAAVYILSPLDFLPDMIPIIGQVDDLLLLALILQRFINSVDRSIVLEYWDGNADILELMERILGFSRYLLPRGAYDRIVKKARKDTGEKPFVDVSFHVK